MRVTDVYSRFAGVLHNFRFARDGNVAITFAFAMLPLLIAVGGAIDYSRANSVKAAMQAALDSTALMVSKEVAKNGSGQLQTNATNYFNTLFTRPEAKSAAITANYTTSGGTQVVVNGSVLVPTSFLGIMGYQNIPVNGSSTVKWGSSRLRVALVLDNTGSMADAGKMTALKTATKSLLNQLQNAAGTNGDVYVSIIPFNKDVNVGSSNYNANWIDWTDWDAKSVSCSGGGSKSEDDSHSGDHDKHSDDGHDKHAGDDHDRHSDDDDSGRGGGCKPVNHNTWNGCVTDRGDPKSGPGSAAGYDQNVSPPIASIIASLYPAEQYASCPKQVMGLSYNWTAMNFLVDQMYPNGSTNQPIGLVWGWLSLVGGGPLTAPTMDTNYQYQQVIILLSDGLNTQDRWYKAQTPVDNRMYQNGNGSGTCANIKAAGITIYTIQVNTGGDPTSTLLKNCASSSDKYWMLTSASQIVTTFNTIGTNLSKLYVAK